MSAPKPKTSRKPKSGRPPGTGHPDTMKRRAIARATWLNEPTMQGPEPVVSPRTRDYLIELAELRAKDLSDAFNLCLDNAIKDVKFGNDFRKVAAMRWIQRLTLNVTQSGQARDRINLHAASVAIEGAKAQQQWSLAQIEESFRAALADPRVAQLIETPADPEGEDEPRGDA